MLQLLLAYLFVTNSMSLMSSQGLLQIQNFLRYVKDVSWRSPGVAGKEASNTGMCHGFKAAVTRSKK